MKKLLGLGLMCGLGLNLYADEDGCKPCCPEEKKLEPPKKQEGDRRFEGEAKRKQFDGKRQGQKREAGKCGSGHEQKEQFEKNDCGLNEEGLKTWLEKRGVQCDTQNVKEHLRKHGNEPCHCVCNQQRTAGKRQDRNGRGFREGQREGQNRKGDRERRERNSSEEQRQDRCDHERTGERGENRRGHGEGEFRREGHSGHEGVPERRWEGRNRCGHERDHGYGEREKGNNGVGNGQDPQPPGNPPQNDGPGTGKGHPGHKGGKGKK